MTKKEKKKEYDKAYREANKERIKAYNEANKENRKAWREANKEKRKEYNKAWHEANKERIKEKAKAYREANREEILKKQKEYNKAYYEANKEKLKSWREANREERNKKNKAWREANRDYQKEYDKERRKTDPLFKLKKNLRCASWRAFKGQTKNVTTEKLLGCSYNDFKDYITAQFVGNMSWDNYGQIWQVDHIIPLATIEDVSQTELISSLCHFSNLQPLFAQDNILKNDRLDYEYPAIYKTNLLHNSNKKQL